MNDRPEDIVSDEIKPKKKPTQKKQPSQKETKKRGPKRTQKKQEKVEPDPKLNEVSPDTKTINNTTKRTGWWSVSKATK